MKKSKKIMRKIIITVILLFSFIAIFINVKHNQVNDILYYTQISDFEYKINNNTKTATLVKYTGKNVEVSIPNIIQISNEEYTVVTIGEEAFYDNNIIEKIKIPETITLIEERAFANCDNLLIVEMPETIKSLGEEVFADCDNLDNINIANNENKEKTYDEEYIKYLQLSEQEKENLPVIPNSEFVPMSAINDKIISLGNTQVEEYYDLRNVIGDKITVDYQNGAGWCWAYASAKSAETFMTLQNNKIYNLSEAHIAYSRCKFFGGTNDITAEQCYSAGGTFSSFVNSETGLKDEGIVKGPVLDSDFPREIYEFTDENLEKFNSATKLIKVTDVQYYPRISKKIDSDGNVSYKNGNNEISQEDMDSYRKVIKNHIKNNGALYCGINWDGDSFNDDTMSLYYNGNFTCNHAVAIVGWDDNYSASNFKVEPPGDGAYICLNSWGESWGTLGGYFYVSYYDSIVDHEIAGVISAKEYNADINIEDIEYLKVDNYITIKIKADEMIEDINGEWDIHYNNDTHERYISKQYPLNSEINEIVRVIASGNEDIYKDVEIKFNNNAEAMNDDGITGNLKDLMSSAKYGETITVVNDITNDENITILDTQNIILDLAGQTVIINKIENQGELTIRDSRTGGKLQVKDIENNDAINNYGVLKIEGGKISGNNAINMQSGAKLTIVGGTLEGNSYGILDKFNSEGIEFTGGLLKGKLKAYSIKGTLGIPEGYRELNLRENEYYEFFVYKNEIVKIKETDTCYQSFMEAINASTENQTIEILADLEVNGSLKIEADKKVKIDLFGNTINIIVDNWMISSIYNLGELTIKDSESNGKIISSTYMYIIENENKLTIESGIIGAEDDNTSSSIYNSGIMFMKEGSIYNSIDLGENVPTLTMTGGKIKSKHIGIFSNNSTGEINISGGEIIGDTYSIKLNNAGMNLNFSGGIFKGKTAVYDIKGEITIPEGYKMISSEGVDSEGYYTTIIKEEFNPTYTRGTDDSEYVTFDYLGEDGTNTGVNINTTNTNCTDASFYYKYQGLEAQELYSVSTYVKVDEIITYEGRAGAFIANWDNSTATSEMISKNTSSAWKKITVIAISEKDGTLKVKFGLDSAKANVVFDKIEIMRADNNSEFKVYSYTNGNDKTAKIVFWSEDVTKYGYTDEIMNNWLDVLLKVREDMRNLTGKEVNNGNVNIIAANYHNYVAYVIGDRVEIQWSRYSVEAFENGADSPFFITHEMGHQHAIDNSDFDSEFWGTTIALLSSYRLNIKLSGLPINGQNSIRQGQSLIDYCYDGGYQHFMIKSSYAGDGLTYLIFQTILSLNKYENNLGFDSLTQTLNYMDTMDNSGGGAGEKFIRFINTWSEFSEKDVKSIIYGFREGDSLIIDEQFGIGKFKYIINDDKQTISIQSYSRDWDEDVDDFYELIIPETIDGYKVTEVVSWAFANDDYLSKVVLPKTITVLRSVAFYNCNNLTTVTIPEDSQLITMEDWVFNRSGLNEIFIPKTVENIGAYVLLYGKNPLTISGYSRTAIQEYAKKNDIAYNPIDVFNIIFNSGGGTECESVEIIVGDAYGQLPTPRRNGYLFEGWYTEAGERIESTTRYNLASDTTLYANWNIVEYTISYNLVDGSLEEGQVNPELYTIEDEDFKLNNPQKVGYLFLGWTGSNGADPQVDVVIKKGSTGNRTYRANWKAICIVNFEDEEGKVIKEMSRPKGETYGELPKLQKKGFTFMGWYTQKTGGEKVMEDMIVNSDVILYARWKANEYTVEYNGNGATGGSTVSSNHIYDEAKKLTANGYIRKYEVIYNYNGNGKEDEKETVIYNFKEWNTLRDGTGTSYKDEEIIKNLTDKMDEKIILYAVWDNVSVNLPIPVKEGNIFKGWYNEEGEKIGEGGEEYIPTGDITLYAYWDDIKPITTMDITKFNDKEYIIIKEKVINENEIQSYTVNDLLTEENFPNTNYIEKVYDSKGQELTKQDVIGSGARVEILNNSNETVSSYILILKGDIDGNGVVDIYDITLLIELRFENNNKTWTDVSKIAGWCAEDNNRANGIPNLYDITRLIEYRYNKRNW